MNSNVNSDYNSIDFNNTSSQITKNNKLIKSSVKSIQHLVNIIGTNNESSMLFDEIQEKQSFTNQIAKETGELLKKLSSFEIKSIPDQKMLALTNERLRNDFSDALNSFQKIQRLVADKEKMAILNAKNRQQFQDEESKDTWLLGANYATEQSSKQILQQDLTDLIEIEEREMAVRRLEADIVGVNEIFRDLATMIHEQGQTIDSIEANVESTAVRIESANKELTQARKHQTSSRKKIIIIICLLALVVLILALIIYFSVRNKNPPLPTPPNKSMTTNRPDNFI